MQRPASKRQWLSLAIALVSGALMLSMGTARFVNDGSFWLDEAAIAYDLISMPPLELFGPLDTGHHFPRLYLSAINQLRFALGYETSVLRALPFACFVAGVLLWQRLLWLRFRERPSWVALGALLCMLPGEWFAYAAMLKQYSLDVLVALLPFLLRDETLDARWRRSERTARLWPWLLPCLLSMTYGIAWLARLLGYWLGTARAQGLKPPARSTALLGFGFALAMGASWWIDLRHATSGAALFGYWSAKGCIATGDLAGDLRLIVSCGLDWTGAELVFSGRVGLPGWARAGLVVAFFAGAGALLAGALARSPSESTATARPLPADEADRVRWGTRGLSALAVVAGLLAAGLLFAYPLCAGRLTLFAFFSMLWVALEGLSFAARAGRSRASAVAAECAVLLMVAATLPGATATARRMWLEDSPENIRPLLAAIAERPERRVVIGPCTSKQALTLPEWIHRDDLFDVDERLARGERAWPEEPEFWLVSTNYGFCPHWTDLTRARALRFERVSEQSSAATLYSVVMPDLVVPEPAAPTASLPGTGRAPLER